jgi:hypothetical protein
MATETILVDELWLGLFRDPSYYQPEPDSNDPTGASRIPPPGVCRI